MSSTYCLQMHKHMRICQPLINQQGTCQAHTICKRANTLSALDQPKKENIKHVHSASTKTHETLSASNQPSKESVKHAQPANAQTHEIQSAPDEPSKEMSSTYIGRLQMHKQRKLSQPQMDNPVIVKHIRPANTPIA